MPDVDPVVRSNPDWTTTLDVSRRGLHNRTIPESLVLQPTVPVEGSHFALALLCSGHFLIAVDFSVLVVALPSLGSALEVKDGALQWVMTAYALPFASLLILGGRLADMWGRVPTLVAGLVGFSCAAAAAGFAPTIEILVAARILQGVAAAVIAPAALSTITMLYPDGRAKAGALGVYSAVLSGGFVAGIFVGGVITEFLSWRWTLWVVVPYGLVAASLIAWRLQDHNSRTRVGHLDLAGAVVVTSAILVIVYGLAHIDSTSSSRMIALLALASGVLLSLLFVRIERRARDPLVPPRLMARRQVIGASIAAGATTGSAVGAVFVLSLYLQKVLGLAPIATALCFAGLGVSSVIAGGLAPRTLTHLRRSHAVSLGLSLQAFGTASLVLISPDGELPIVICATAILGFGNTTAIAALTALGTATVASSEQGIVVGLLSSAHEVGAAIGMTLVAAAISGATMVSVSLARPTTAATVQSYKVGLVVATLIAVLGAVSTAMVTRRRFVAAGRASAVGRGAPERGCDM